ncbi:MAG: DUF3119 family protein [Cyanobacteria bacterium]|nr:DUF3119 family protein [Cyanobacteriota bacterium]
MTPETPSISETVELAPSYTLAIAVVLIGAAIVPLQIWVGGIVALFGGFLLLQSALLRLQFTTTNLDVYRNGKVIRSFPYSEWSHWEIFWQPIPILFYFREVNSIHFLPILFDPKMLQVLLKQRCPQLPTEP